MGARRIMRRLARPVAAILGSAPTRRLLPNLLPNGTFDNATGWSLAASCTVANGKLHCNNTLANVTNSYALSLPAGSYRLTYTLTDYIAGSVIMRLNCGGTIVSGTTHTTGTPDGTYSCVVTAASPVTSFEVRVARSGTSMDVKVDDIIINQQ